MQGASGKPPACIDRRQLCRKQVPLAGNDAPTPARADGVPPRRGIVLSFDAKESTKESMRHGDSGKKPFIAHFGGGARYVARSGVGQLRLLSCALGARLFPPSKWAGLFPSAAYRRSAPPQLAVGKLTPCKLRCFDVAGRFCGVDKWADSLIRSRRGAGFPLAGWDASVWHKYFCRVTGQRDFDFTLAFLSEP